MTRAGLSAKPRTLVSILGLTAAVSLVAGLFAVDTVGERQIEHSQRAVALTARDYFVTFAREEGMAPMAEALDRRSRTENGAFTYALYENGGRLVGGDDLAPYAMLPVRGFKRITVEGRAYEVLTERLDGRVLAIVEDLGGRRDFRLTILAAALVAISTGLVLMTLAGVMVQRLLVRRAQGLANAASKIAAGDMTARAPTRDEGDVFDELGRDLNDMLARIESLMSDLRLTTDSLAHDLRLPIARMQRALGRAADPEVPEAERLREASNALAASEDISTVLTTLLDIARAESGISRSTMSQVDLNEIAAELAELFSPLFEDAGQTFQFQAPAGPVVGLVHPLLLRQALGNILHNAANYAGEGARVVFRLQQHDGRAAFTVIDNGPGVSSAQRGRISQRFVRGDLSRGTPGTGLGLAIAAACAKLHQGRLQIEDAQPGLSVLLELSLGEI